MRAAGIVGGTLLAVILIGAFGIVGALDYSDAVRAEAHAAQLAREKRARIVEACKLAGHTAAVAVLRLKEPDAQLEWTCAGTSARMAKK